MTVQLPTRRPVAQRVAIDLPCVTQIAIATVRMRRPFPSRSRLPFPSDWWLLPRRDAPEALLKPAGESIGIEGIGWHTF